MKHVVFSLLALLYIAAAEAQLVEQMLKLVDWVNPLMGTDSKASLSNGNTYPAITRHGA